MSKKRESEYLEIDEDINYRWDGPKYNAVEMEKKSKLFVRELSKELLDAADDYICNKTEEVKESVTSRMSRIRDKIKSSIVRKIIKWIEFCKKIVFFKFLKRKLDRLRQRTEQFNAENSVGELREKIGERLTKIRSVCVFLELRGNYG
ncbi:MAG: hypothetical protein V3U53_05315 [bacterium]